MPTLCNFVNRGKIELRQAQNRVHFALSMASSGSSRLSKCSSLRLIAIEQRTSTDKKHGSETRGSSSNNRSYGCGRKCKSHRHSQCIRFGFSHCRRRLGRSDRRTKPRRDGRRKQRREGLRRTHRWDSSDKG